MLLLSTSTRAADIVEPATYDWSGAYIGLHAGYFWEDVDYIEPGNPSTLLHRDDETFIGGPYLGFNHQIDRLVVSAEGDFGLGDIDIGAGAPQSDNNCSLARGAWAGGS